MSLNLLSSLIISQVFFSRHHFGLQLLLQAADNLHINNIGKLKNKNISWETTLELTSK
jgi:DNA transposition AAA+ family ATPase